MQSCCTLLMVRRPFPPLGDVSLAKWMSRPASTTAAFIAPAPTPDPPTSPCAGVRQAPPTGDLQSRLPPDAISLGVNSGLQYVPATTVAGQFGRPTSAPQLLICASDA